MKLAAMLLVISALPGCGVGVSIGDHFNAQGRMDQAGKDYRKCLSNNIDKPRACDPLKEMWQADKIAYETGKY
jgi:hypothetical protein